MNQSITQEVPSDWPPFSVVVIAASLARSSNVSASSSPVIAEHSAYLSQRSSCAIRQPQRIQLVNEVIQGARLQFIVTHLLWVDDSLAFSPQVPFQAYHHHWKALAMAVLEVTSNVISPLRKSIGFQHEVTLAPNNMCETYLFQSSKCVSIGDIKG